VFWTYGHELFRSTAETFPVKFIAGNVLSPSIIAPRVPFDMVPKFPPPKFQSLKSLTPIQGFASAVLASMFFHLFDEEEQLLAAHQLGTLLSTVPGSIIFGVHAGSHVKGHVTIEYDGLSKALFCHSVDSWRNVWDGQVFPKGTVRVDAQVKKCKEFAPASLKLTSSEDALFLIWCITRL
jgi:hypothetical protein